jgi:hypothetical protein
MYKNCLVSKNKINSINSLKTNKVYSNSQDTSSAIGENNRGDTGRNMTRLFDGPHLSPPIVGL